MVYLLPLISTSFIVLSAILVAFGWYFIYRGNMELHKNVMIWASTSAVLFFVIYVSRTIFIGNTAFGGPEQIRSVYLVFLLFHIVLAAIAAVMGIMTLVYAFKNQVEKHKKMGPWAALIWFVTASTGVTVYFLLYVIYPPGPTTNMLRAIFG